MKLSKEELIAKIDEKVMDEDVKIELMEDITDSFEGEKESVDSERVKELEEKLRVMTEKYKERFLKGDEEKKEVAEEKEVDDEELKEEEVIDIKEI